MSTSSLDWEQLYWTALYAGPNFVGWCLAVFFCLTRRRDNPKGATYLGLAVMVSFFMTVVLYGWYYFVDFMGMTGILGYNEIQYFLVGFHALTKIVFWILLIAAVFARPVHYDYSAGPMFDDQQV